LRAVQVDNSHGKPPESILTRSGLDQVAFVGRLHLVLLSELCVEGFNNVFVVDDARLRPTLLLPSSLHLQPQQLGRDACLERLSRLLGRGSFFFFNGTAAFLRVVVHNLRVAAGLAILDLVRGADPVVRGEFVIGQRRVLELRHELGGLARPRLASLCGTGLSLSLAV